MNRGILDRYLLREAGGAWLAVTIVLLAIMLSTRFAKFLVQAASGKLPRELLFEVAALSSVQYLVILIPFSLLLAILLALGRLYKDNEIAAMMGCGVGFTAFYRPFLLLAALLAILTAALSFQVGPWAGRAADKLIKDSLMVALYNPFEMGRFKEVSGGRGVFYTSKIDAEGRNLEGIFALVREPDGEAIITAQTGQQDVEINGQRQVVLRNGQRYLGMPGQLNYDIMKFQEFRTRVDPPTYLNLHNKRKLEPTSVLIASGKPEDRAELEMRLAAPLSVFILGLLAVPLAHMAPREGRYGKLVLGILVYLAYSQLMGLGQNWIAKDKAIGALGLWWVHGIVLASAVALILKRQGRWKRAR